MSRRILKTNKGTNGQSSVCWCLLHLVLKYEPFITVSLSFHIVLVIVSTVFVFLQVVALLLFLSSHPLSSEGCHHVKSDVHTEPVYTFCFFKLRGQHRAVETCHHKMNFSTSCVNMCQTEMNGVVHCQFHVYFFFCWWEQNRCARSSLQQCVCFWGIHIFWDVKKKKTIILVFVASLVHRWFMFFCTGSSAVPNSCRDWLQSGYIIHFVAAGRFIDSSISPANSDVFW